jgi:hypothetical protein
MILDIDHDRTRAEWYHTPVVSQPSTEECFAKGFEVAAGTSTLVEVGTPTCVSQRGLPARAPDSLMSLWLRGEGRTRLDYA